jgi:hypothetical protein
MKGVVWKMKQLTTLAVGGPFLSGSAFAKPPAKPITPAPEGQAIQVVDAKGKVFGEYIPSMPYSNGGALRQLPDGTWVLIPVTPQGFTNTGNWSPNHSNGPFTDSAYTEPLAATLFVLNSDISSQDFMAPFVAVDDGVLYYVSPDATPQSIAIYNLVIPTTSSTFPVCTSYGAATVYPSSSFDLTTLDLTPPFALKQ